MNKKIILISVIIVISVVSIAIGIFILLREPSVETPETPEFSSCVVLGEEHCKKGEALYDENNEFVGLGFSLPEGTEIYAPFDGFLDNSLAREIFEGALHTGFEIMKAGEYEQRNYFSVIGGLKTTIHPEELISPEEPERLANEPVEKGQSVAIVTGDQKIIIPDGEKDYDIAIYIMKYDSLENIWTYNIELLRDFFNYIKI